MSLRRLPDIRAYKWATTNRRSQARLMSALFTKVDILLVERQALLADAITFPAIGPGVQ
jgi:hypothetical protein